MSRKTLGLYDHEGNVIIEYDGFDSTDYKFMYIATGWGSGGSWQINADFNPFNFDITPAESLEKIEKRFENYLGENFSRSPNYVKNMNQKVKLISNRILTHYNKLSKEKSCGKSHFSKQFEVITSSNDVDSDR